MEEAFKINQKSNRNRNDTAVQGTNDSSVLSKISAAECGYVRDEYLKYFANKVVRRSPLVNRGYYIRARLVDNVISEFLNRATPSRDSKKQIVNLGAGFDSSFFRLKHLNRLENVTFIEIDFPDVINRKVALINKNPELLNLCPDLTMSKEINGNAAVYQSLESSYFLIGIDMRNTKLLEAILRAMEQFSDTRPTFLLSEVVLTYMAVNSCNSFIQWVAEVFQNCVLTAYEQINPFDGFGQVMCTHFKKLGSPLKCILKYPHEIDQINRYKQAGFENCYTAKASDYYLNQVDHEEKSRLDKIELFDEYEAWHMKCTHYMILSAVKGEFCEAVTRDGFYKKFNEEAKPPANVDSLIKMEPFGVKCGVRFGHKMCRMGSKLVIFGGFGELATDSQGKHLRQNSIEVVDLHSGQLSVIELNENVLGDRIFHTCDAVSDNEIYISLGRTNPSRLYDTIIKVCFLSDNDVKIEKIEYKTMDEDIKLARYRHATCLLSDSRLFIHGGKYYDEQSGNKTVLGDAYLLRSDHLISRVNIDDKLCTARHSHSICTWGNKIVISGGVDQNESPLDDILLIDSDTFQVNKLNITKGSILPRYSHTSHVVDDVLILVGGVNCQVDSPGVALVDLKKQIAQEFNLPFATPDSSPFLPLCHQTCLMDDKNKVLVVGGGAVCFTFGTHLNKQPVMLDLSDCWSKFNEFY